MSEETKIILDYLRKEVKEALKWEQYHKKQLIDRLNTDTVVNDIEIAQYEEARDHYIDVCAMVDVIEDELRMKNRK